MDGSRASLRGLARLARPGVVPPHEPGSPHRAPARERCLVGSWPAPSLYEGPIGMPYCDNLTIFGTSPRVVNEKLKGLMGVFKQAGFTLHEVEWASTMTQPLGALFDGVSWSIRPRPEWAWRLRGALRYAASGLAISGRSLETLLGHYVFEGLFHRPSLSVLRACYRDSYWQATPVWDSVASELLACSALLPITSGALGNPWAEK